MTTVDLRTWAGNFETTGERCPCGKLRLACIGPGPFGSDQTYTWCLACDEGPEATWAALDPGRNL